MSAVRAGAKSSSWWSSKDMGQDYPSSSHKFQAWRVWPGGYGLEKRQTSGLARLGLGLSHGHTVNAMALERLGHKATGLELFHKAMQVSHDLG